MRLAGLAMAIGLVAAGPVAAHREGDMLAAVRAAEARGAELLAYSEAARIAAESYATRTGVSPDLQRIVVVPGASAGSLSVVFYDGGEPSADALATMTVAEGRVTAQDAASGSALSPTVRRMIAARTAALDSLSGATPLCSQGPPTVIALPPGAGGAVPVYIFPARGGSGSFPLGGAWRVDVAADGAPGTPQALAGPCMTAEWNPADDDVDMHVAYTTYPAADQPSEFHTYASTQMPFALGVVTGDYVWPVIGGSIADPVLADPDMGIGG